VHIVALGCADQAEEIQRRLAQAGIESLYDDRNERAGVQFADADLIGAPIRITVSDRSIRQGGVEVKLRNGQEKRILPLESVEQEILREWRSVADSG
jgi:prolyl-tRNA synthetase